MLQLFRAPRGRIQPLSQMGQDLQVHDRKLLEGLPRKQGTRSLETMTKTNAFRNGKRTRDFWKSTRVLLQTDRGGYREPPELAEGGTREAAAQKGTTGRQEERLKGPRAQAAGGQPGPKASNQQPNHCSKA